MAGIDEVLERLVGDSAFRQALARDPQAALSGYDLTGEDVELLTAQLDEGSGAEHGVEQRTSKSAIAGFLAQAFSGGGGEAVESQDLSVWQSQFGEISTEGPDGGEESHRGVQDLSAVKWVSRASSSSSVGQSQFGEPNQAGDSSHKDWIDLLSVSQAQGSEEPAADLTTEEPDPEGIGLLIPAIQKAPDGPEPDLDLSGQGDSSDDMAATGRLTGLRSAGIEDSGGGTEEADFTGDGAVDAADFLAWQRGHAAEPAEDLAGSQPDASATPKLYETAAKGTYPSEDSGDPDGLTSAEAVPAAEDTAQQSGDPDQPVVIGSVFNSEAGSDVSATGPPDLAGSEGSAQYQESDLEFITDSAPDQAGTQRQGLGFHSEYKGADGSWYRSEPTVSLGGDDAPPDGTDAAAAAIQAEGGDAAGGPVVEYEVEEGEK